MAHDEILSREVLEQAPQPESNSACSDLIPSPDDGLPPIPPECQKAWEVVEARVGHDTRTFKGLRFLLAGYSYRESARESGLSDPRTLRDAVNRLGIHDAVASTNRAVAAHRRIRQGAQEILLHKLESGEMDDEKPAVLGVVMGIADDKIRAHEDKQGSNNNALDALQAIGQRIAEAGVQIDISISPVRAYEIDGRPPVAGRDPGTSGVETG